MSTQETAPLHQSHHNGSVSGPLSDLKIAEPYVHQSLEQHNGEHHTESTASKPALQSAHHPSASVSIEVNIGNGHNDPDRHDDGSSPSQNRQSDMHYAPINNLPVVGQICR